MPILNNFADQCELVNLAGQADGHGPYFLRQTGYAPSSATFRQDMFYLRKDGTWVIGFSALMLSEEEIHTHYLFPTAGEALALLGEISSAPTLADDKLPEDKSPEEILAVLKATASKLIAHIQNSKGYTPSA